MDDISLIEHIMGDKSVAKKLRQTGYTTLQKIGKAKPTTLAKKTNFNIELAGKIISSAKLLNRQAQSSAKINSETKAKGKLETKAKTKSKKNNVKTAFRRKKTKTLRGVIKKRGSKKIKKLIKNQEKVIKKKASLNILEDIDLNRLLGFAATHSELKEKILKEVIIRKSFREKLRDKLVKSLIED